MFRPRYCLVTLLVLIFSLTATSQLKYYGNPLGIPLSLSGNFGELRPNHFHTGLDFRTQQKTGLPVLSSADGYVSRIVVSPSGYGKVMYVDHPNGTTTVYGHLDRFNDEIGEFVREEQYKRKSFAVDLKVPAGKFPVTRGEQIARSGNTGSSGGPHLHYEIRTTHSEDAINPLLENDFGIKDKTPPKIFALRIYPLDEESHVNMGRQPVTLSVTAGAKGYALASAAPVRVWGKIGLSVRANDYFDNNASPCGIFSARLLVNEEEIFSSRVDRISFDQNRYLNSHIDYAEFVRKAVRYQRLWRERGNRLSIYETDRSRGVVKIDEETSCHIHVILTDVAGNKSQISFELMGKEPVSENLQSKTGEVFSYDSRNSFSTPDFDITTPSGAFYEDFTFHFRKVKGLAGCYSPVYKVHEKTVPLQKPAKISLQTDALPDRLKHRALVVELDAEGRKSYIGGKVEGDRMVASITGFGDFTVVCDTVPPVITALGIKNNALTETNAIRFRISDNLSGISTYEGLIDNQWALFEYDPKTNMLVYFIDRARLVTGKRHTLQLTVSDRVQNKAVYKATFWK
ncbi:MAG TPA: M23 family metallopeptidase [Prolixibacteraceae bacterium]|nr:M23 family metallopeptidase [Prolixibacteraceae bacterium]